MGCIGNSCPVWLMDSLWSTWTSIKYPGGTNLAYVIPWNGLGSGVTNWYVDNGIGIKAVITVPKMNNINKEIE